MFRFKEARDSQRSSHFPPSIELVYNASGNNSGTFVRTFALNATPAIAAHERGTLYRQDIKVDPVGFEQFRVTIPYGPRKVENGKYTFDFDTTGGTLQIKQSRATRASYKATGVAADPPDFKGAIGVRGDQVDGCEIVVPALKLGVSFTHPAGIITIAQAKALSRFTGVTNSTPFMTFAPGEILFLGAAGQEGTEVETTVRYQFAASENVTGQTFGPFANVTKYGWDHTWVRFADGVDGGSPVKVGKWLYVEQVYREIDLAALLGFGS